MLACYPPVYSTINSQNIAPKYLDSNSYLVILALKSGNRNRVLHIMLEGHTKFFLFPNERQSGVLKKKVMP